MRISNNESPELAGSHQPCSEQPDVFSTVIKITISSYSRFFNLYDGARSLISALCIAAVFLLPNTALAQTVNTQRQVFARLQKIDVLDDWGKYQVLDAARSLIQVSGGQFSGAQVNGDPHPGWLSIYLIDSGRVPEGTPIIESPVEVHPEKLSAGGWTHGTSGTILIDTAYWKRLTAATLMTQRRSPRPILQALATVDVRGLASVRGYWDETVLAEDSPEVRMTKMLMQGALRFVLAHEMGHVGQSERLADPNWSQPKRPTRSDARLHGRSRGCDEFSEATDRAQRAAEQAADRYAAHLVGRLCQLPSEGRLHHEITTLGASWYMTAAVADKTMSMGLADDRTPYIERTVSRQLGADLYAALKMQSSRAPTKGVIAVAFPSSHPPDTERMRAFEGALATTPCGAAGLEIGQAQALEQVRQAMCQSLENVR